MKLWLRIFYIMAVLEAFLIGYHGIREFPDPNSHSGYEGFGILMGVTGILFICMGVGYLLFAISWLKTNRSANIALGIFLIPITIIAIISAYFTLRVFTHINPPLDSPFQVFTRDLTGLALFPFLGYFLLIIWGVPAFLLTMGTAKAIKEKFSKNIN